jgi:hypothetical protein
VEARITRTSQAEPRRRHLPGEPTRIQELDIEGRSQMTRDELIEALREKQ